MNLTSSVSTVGRTGRPHTLSTPIRHPFTRRVCQACVFYSAAWDRLHALWPVNKEVRQISVPFHKNSLLQSVKQHYTGVSQWAFDTKDVLAPSLLWILSVTQTAAAEINLHRPIREVFQSMVSYEQTQNKHINNNIYCYNTHTYDYYIFIEYILIINILKYYILLVSVILLLLSLYISCMVQADSWFGHFILWVKLYWLVKRNSLDNSFNILRGPAGWILTYYLPTLALQLRTPGQTHLIIHTLWGCGCLYCWGVQ